MTHGVWTKPSDRRWLDKWLYTPLSEAAAPVPNRPDEFWWIRTDEGMPMKPARVIFEGDAPYRIQQFGDGMPLGDLVETVPHIQLVERILPPGRVAEVIPILEDVLSQQDAAVPGQQLFEAIALLQAGA